MSSSAPSGGGGKKRPASGTSSKMAMGAPVEKKRPLGLDSAEAKTVKVEKAGRGLFLVKVPRYLSSQWEANPGSAVGQLYTNGKEVVLKSTLPSTSKADGLTAAEIPQQHSFSIRAPNEHAMVLLSENKFGLEHKADRATGKLALEGVVVKRVECQPPNSDAYMKLKIRQFEKSSQPTRQIIQMEKAEVKYKPVAIHAENLAHQKAKKEAPRTSRANDNDMVEMIFHAFEQHQYYKFHDLVKVTNQPPGNVKASLEKIATYRTAPPHKFTWELKPEFRNYTVNSQSKDETKEGEMDE